MAITVRRSEERGHANHGWLDSYHTFSFGGYRDPEHMGFRVLRVINEDRVQPDNGFGTHPHDNMEIISYVVSGELEHKDSMGNGSVITAGEVQIITAGTGITHSEFNPSMENETHFYQIWVFPEQEGLQPNYQQKSFAEVNGNASLHLIASKSGDDDALVVNQDISLFRSVLQSGESVRLPLEASRYGWLQIVSGKVYIEGETLSTGDGAAISDIVEPTVTASADSELLFFDLP